MFDIGISIIFFIKALLLGIATIVAIPKEQYRKLLIYSIFLGGFIDLIIIVVFDHLNLLKYLNMGPFSLYGRFTFWTPIAWMFAVMIFLYFLPVRKIFFYPYIVIWAIFGIFLGSILENFGLYRFDKPILFFTFLLWFFFAAIAYTYLEKIELKSNIIKE